MVSTRANFITSRVGVTIPEKPTNQPRYGPAILKDSNVSQPVLARRTWRTCSGAHYTHRSRFRHLGHALRINLVQGKHSRTGETLKSNLGGGHD